jgi:hypothetical protein
LICAEELGRQRRLFATQAGGDDRGKRAGLPHLSLYILL